MLDSRLHAIVPMPPPAKRRRLSGGGFLFLIMIVAAIGVLAYAYRVAVYVSPDQRIHDGIERVEVEMTEEQVNEIMGGHATKGEANTATPEQFRLIWESENARGIVTFKDGRVVSKGCEARR